METYSSVDFKFDGNANLEYIGRKLIYNHYEFSIKSENTNDEVIFKRIHSDGTPNDFNNIYESVYKVILLNKPDRRLFIA